MGKKTALILAVVVAALSWACVCRASSVELKLGVEHRTFGTGINSIRTDSEIELWFGYNPHVTYRSIRDPRTGDESIVKVSSSGDMEYLLSWTLSSSGVGETCSISANTDPDFDIMASVLTNGESDPLGFQIYENGAYSGLFYWESLFPKIPKDLVAEGVDFKGYTITRIDAKLNDFTFEHFIAANYTKFFWDVEVAVWGTPNLPGDFNGDGDVDGVDFGIWQANYSTANGAALSIGDFDGDGDVDGVDFGIWQANYSPNSGAAMATTPEPATLLVLALGLGGVLLRRAKQTRTS